MFITHINVDNIPAVSLDVEQHLQLLLAEEVNSYFATIQGKRSLLCPLRVFYRRSRLKAHKSHHCTKNNYVADGRSHQLAVVRARYYHHLAIAPLFPFHASSTPFLALAASLIAK